MTLTEAKEIADSPAGKGDEQLRAALARLEDTRNNGGATRKLERRCARLIEALGVEPIDPFNGDGF